MVKFAFLWWLIMLSSFSSAYCPVVYLCEMPFEDSVLVFLSVLLKKIFFSLTFELLRFLTYSRYLPFARYGCRYFLPFCNLHSYFLNGVLLSRYLVSPVYQNFLWWSLLSVSSVGNLALHPPTQAHKDRLRFLREVLKS